MKPISTTAKMDRIAVCLYGQYRTGDYVIPRIRQHFSKLGIDVDYFCSIKASNTYDRFNQGDASYSGTSSNCIDHITNFLNPVSINVLLDTDNDKYMSSTITAGFIDVVKLKQLHELSEGIQYDMVFMLRYDVLLDPITFASTILSVFRNKTVEEVNKITKGAGEFIIAGVCYDNYMFNAMPNLGAIQDLALIGTSLGIDLICAEMSNYVAPSIHNDPVIEYIDDGHSLFVHACNNAGVTIVDQTIIPDYNLAWAVVRPNHDSSINVFTDDAFIHNVKNWYDTGRVVENSTTSRAPWFVEFKSDYTWPEDSAVAKVLNRQWNLTNDKDCNEFFELSKRSYLEYNKHNPTELHYKNIEKYINSESVLPNTYYENASELYPHLTSLNNGNVLYMDRGSDITIVVINNHATWIDSVHGAEQGRGSLHYYTWIVGEPAFKNYNFISINEDLNMLPTNKLMYPSWYMCNPDGVSAAITSIFPHSEYYVYSPCKNSMSACYIADNINASRVFIEQGSTSFIASSKLLDSIHYKDTEYFDYDECYDNVIFMSLCREKYFNVETLNVATLEELVTSNNNNCKYLYYEAIGEITLKYLAGWSDIANNISSENLIIEQHPFKTARDNERNIRRSAISFFS